MLLYILSQIIGSTLALEYMRAEYVAPLGSTSLVFNFLFARFLVGTPVTSTDIYGTIVVILGVIGIVAFGSINSGLTTKTDVEHLTYLWRRGGWLGFFFTMTFALICVLVFTSRLDAVLVARGDLGAVPFSGMGPGTPPMGSGESSRKGPTTVWGKVGATIKALRAGWAGLMRWITGWLEVWTGPQDDKQVAWTLGIGWACCGGGLAGGCLVFAKATVKLLSGSLSKQNPGNQFGHAAPIFTILLLAATAVMQIICLNRGLRVYDSTLVVPVFYGVYTATGFLNSLIFNDEVDAYQSWTLFLIFASILVLISGVVLLTHKKPEPVNAKTPGGIPLQPGKVKGKSSKKPSRERGEGEQDVLWAVGDDSDDGLENGRVEDGDGDGDDDVDHHQHPLHNQYHHQNMPDDQGKGKGKGAVRKAEGEEGVGLIHERDELDEEDEERHKDTDVMDRYQHQSQAPDGSGGTGSKTHLSSRSSSGLHIENPFRDEPQEEFGDWQGVRTGPPVVGRR
ncbi:hypothetical protein BDZ94DRAFT_1255042 [Collybia nuda]|uniref:Uncharacterized protein n=1 Tax=Collybia nuda TaxID=64659 RepID=A0A9P5Y966_9AGAR|nr:hypothetical protein BDZ94DRAFT_1255042 [Collybia nuda]